MGYYIQTPLLNDKAAQIVSLYKGKEIPKPKVFEDIPQGKALICIVNNGVFEAAAFCFGPLEFGVFAQTTDRRPKRWVLLDLDLACELTGYKAQGQ